MHIAQSETTYMDSSWSSTLFEHFEVQVSANLSPQIAVLVLTSSMNTRTGSQQRPLRLTLSHSGPREGNSRTLPSHCFLSKNPARLGIQLAREECGSHHLQTAHLKQSYQLFFKIMYMDPILAG